MRVALIGPVPPELGGLTPGGVATHQVHLAEGLSAHGVEAPLLATNTFPAGPHEPSPRSQADSTGFMTMAQKTPAAGTGLVLHPVVEEIRVTGESFRALGGVRQWLRYALRVVPMRGYGSRRDVLRNLLVYRRFLAGVCPDLVHVQHPLERCTYARLVRGYEGWQMPLVVTAHSLFGEHAEDTIYKQMAPNLRAADRVIAVSDHIADQAIELGVAEQRVRVIRSGVDTERFRPRDRVGARQRLGVRMDVALVLFVGNLEPRKQVDVLLRAMAEVRRQVPHAQLLVVGSGESAGIQDQSARLQRLSAELGLTDAVRFAGRLDESRLLDAYAAADVFALASSSEAQGIVALEAMACGLSVVATAVGGLLGTIDDGETGYLVPASDVAALADRLAGVLADASRQQRVGAAARRAVEARFSWPRAIEATLEVYREALDECA